MSKARPNPSATLLVRSNLSLGLSQQAFGELLGVSRSTVGRWTSRGFGQLVRPQLETLVRALHPVDPDLAGEVARHHHETVESLGVALPAPAASGSSAASPPPLNPLVVDTVVCAAAELAGGSPASVRPLLLAAFERAAAVGLSVEAVIVGLRARAGAKVAP